MSSNVRYAFPIELMDESRARLPTKKMWVAYDSIFAVEIPGDTVYLDKEDFLFFGRRSGGRYFIVYDEHGNPTEYSLLSGSRTFSKASKDMERVTVGEDEKPLVLPLLPQEPVHPHVPEDEPVAVEEPPRGVEATEGDSEELPDSPPMLQPLVALGMGEAPISTYDEKRNRGRPGFWKKPLGRSHVWSGDPDTVAIRFVYLKEGNDPGPPKPTGRWSMGQLRMPTNKGGTRTPCLVTNPLDGKVIDLNE